MGLAWIPLKGHVSHKWTVMSNMCGQRLGGSVPDRQIKIPHATTEGKKEISELIFNYIC